MQVTQNAQIEVNSELKNLACVLSWFDQLYQPQISKKFWMQCQLALAEGFTNAVRHAHKQQSEEILIVEVRLSPEGIEIRIWDQGPPFDLEQRLSKLPTSVDESAIGGRGLKLMLHIADQLSYTRTADDRNCLLIAKRYGGDRGLSHSNIARFS